MHPHLYTDEKQAACSDVIRQLQECREKGWLSRLTGACTGIDKELGKCLRQERLDRTRRNQEKSKERNRKKEEAWKSL